MISMDDQWYVFYTLPKHEKKVYDDLLAKHYNVFMPTQKIVRQWSDRKKKVVVPLFPNYVFVKSQQPQLFSILRIAGVVRVLVEDKRPVPIPDKEIDRIQIMINGGRALEVIPHEMNFIPGEHVKISYGPFAGLIGHLVRAKGNYRLLVELKTLHKILQLDIAADYLERLEHESLSPKSYEPLPA